MNEKANIYILESSLGQQKIGYTRCLSKRLMTFAVKLPFKVSLLHTIEVDQSKVAYYEKWLHQYLDDYRINGEWFVLDYTSLRLLVEYIETQEDLDYLIWYTDKSGECEWIDGVISKQMDYTCHVDNEKNKIESTYEDVDLPY